MHTVLVGNRGAVGTARLRNRVVVAADRRVLLVVDGSGNMTPSQARVGLHALDGRTRVAAAVGGMDDEGAQGGNEQDPNTTSDESLLESRLRRRLAARTLWARTCRRTVAVRLTTLGPLLRARRALGTHDPTIIAEG